MSEKMEFLSGAGKSFEISKHIANAVLARGGTQDHVMRLLNEPVDEIADILVGTAIVIKRPLKDVACDKKASNKMRVEAILILNDQKLAFGILSRNGKGAEGETIVAKACVEVIKDENLLLNVALMSRQDSSRVAVEKIQTQSYLLNIAINSSRESVTMAAVGKLNQQGLRVSACQVGNARVRAYAISRIEDVQFLTERLTHSNGEQNSFVRPAIAKRIRELESAE